MTAMPCDEVREVLPEWGLGTLPDGEAAALAAHLELCVECAAEARVIARLRTAVPAVPAALEWRVLGAVRRSRSRSHRFTPRQLAVAATLAVSVIGGSVLLQVVGNPPEAPGGRLEALPEASASVLLPALEDPVLPGGSVIPNLTEAELESLLARMES